MSELNPASATSTFVKAAGTVGGRAREGSQTPPRLDLPPRPRRWAFGPVLPSIVLALGCGGPENVEPPVLSRGALENAEYLTSWTGPGRAQLSAGSYEDREARLKIRLLTYATGELDGDGDEDSRRPA